MGPAYSFSWCFHRPCFDLSGFAVKIAKGWTSPSTTFLDEGILESAYTWLCQRRRNYLDHADVWNFRRHSRREIARLHRELLEGS